MSIMTQMLLLLSFYNKEKAMSCLAKNTKTNLLNNYNCQLSLHRYCQCPVLLLKVSQFVESIEMENRLVVAQGLEGVKTKSTEVDVVIKTQHEELL